MKRQAILNRDLFFDTGLMKNIFHSDKPALDSTFWKSINKYNNFRNNEPFVICATHSLLEYVGFSKTQRDIFKLFPEFKNDITMLFKKLAIDTANQDMAHIFQMVIDKYKSTSIFSKDELSKRIIHENNFRTAYGQSVASIFLKNLDNKRAFDTLASRFAFNSIINFNFQEIELEQEIVEEIYNQLLKTMKTMMVEDYHGFSFASFAELRKIAVSKHSTNPKLYSQGEIGVDSDIVSYAVIGSFQSGKHNSVSVFTTENIKIWRARAEQYAIFLSDLLNPDFIIYPGSIYLVDQATGMLTDSIDIYEILMKDPKIALKYKQEQVFI